MKKFFALAAAAIIALGASAQNWYAGGSVGFQQTKQAGEKTTTINFMPEVGYNLSLKMVPHFLRTSSDAMPASRIGLHF